MKNANRTDASRPNQNAMDDICDAVLSSFLPSACAKVLAPPTPKRFEIAVSIKKIGAATATAAVCAGSFKSPTKYVSAKLYMSVTIWLMIAGTICFLTAIRTGIFSNNSVLSIEIFFLFLNSFKITAALYFRKLENKTRSDTFDTFDVNGSIVEAYNPAHHGKAESGTAIFSGTAFVYAIETLPDSV